MPLTLRPLAHSEIGLVRKTNQDSGYASASMLLVADGMGGAAAGDLASAVVARQLCHADDDPVSGEEALQVLRDHTTPANAALADLVAANPDLEGMGTTVCGAIFDGTALNIVHIGDSRGYLLSDGTLRRLTHDHSYVQSLVDDGRLDERQAMTHPHRSLLLKVLNGQPDATPDYFSAEVTAGDRIMFCSDGLCGLVADPDLQTVLKLWDIDQAMETLIELAHAAGGTDNITIVLADVVEATPLPPVMKPTVPTQPVLEPGEVSDEPVAGGTVAGEHVAGESVAGDTGLGATSELATATSGLAADVGAAGQPDQAATGTGEPRVVPATDETAEPGAEPNEPGEPASGEPAGSAANGPGAGPDQPTESAPDKPKPESEPDHKMVMPTGPAASADTSSAGPAEPGAEPTMILSDSIAPGSEYTRSGLIGAAANPDIIALLDKMAGHTDPTGKVPHVSRTPAKNRTRLNAAAQERERYSPAPRKRHWGVWIIVAAIIVVLGGAGFGVYTYGAHQFYVGDDNGQVAIYQGLPGTIAGINTSRVYQTTDIAMADLPLSWRAKVSATIPITSGGLDQAQATVQQLNDKAQQCLTNRATRSPTDPAPQDGC